MRHSTTAMAMILLLAATAVHASPYHQQSFEEVSPFSGDLDLMDNWIFTFDNPDGESNHEFENQNDLQFDQQYEDPNVSYEETEENVVDDMIIPLIKTRNELKDVSKRWPGGVIPYKIDSFISSGIQKRIKKAMDAFHENTCIKFTPHEGDEGDFVEIIPSFNGCRSNVGRQGGRQTLRLTIDCGFNKGKIIHELMHTIGFYHEQSRSDRDDYIEIIWDNIKDGEAENFEKLDLELDDFGVGYDYDSVMHYSNVAFSHNGLPTIIVKGNKDVKIGQRERLSEKDIEKVRKMYNCPVTESKK